MKNEAIDSLRTKSFFTGSYGLPVVYTDKQIADEMRLVARNKRATAHY
jgi:hypothetical protein